MARDAYGAFCREPHGDGSADANFALQVQRAAVHFAERLGQRQAQPRALVSAVEVAVDLLEWSHRLCDVLRRDANSGIDDLEYTAAVQLAPKS